VQISYSRYTAFLTNPEKFRLYYILGLTPEDDETPNRMNLGRRRGRCFHEMYEGIAREELVKTYGLELVKRVEEMRAVVPDLGTLSHVEESFELPILDGKHSIIGRMDHAFSVDENFRLGDFKSTRGTRTKKELTEYLGTLETSAQSHFYLYAARALGFPTELFTYHVVLDKKDKEHKPTYIPLDLQPIGEAQLQRTMAEVYAACESITHLRSYGEEKPWPHSNNWPCCGDRFFCGYTELCGRTIPKGCVPPGFTSRYKELIQTETGDTQ
jgi:hypothetical protein